MAQDKICSVISKLLEKTKVVSTEAKLKPNLSTVYGGNAEQLFGNICYHGQYTVKTRIGPNTMA